MAKYTAPKPIKKKQIGHADGVFIALTLTLVVFGLIMMFSSSSANGLYLFGDSYYFIKDQVLFAALGIAAMVIISFIPYRILHNFAWLMYAVSEVLLVITLFMPELNGAKRWIIIGGFTFQPSEITKFAVICLFAHLISIHPENMKNFRYGFMLPILILGSIAAIMMQQVHLSGTILICLVGVCMILIAGAKLRWFVFAGALAVPAGIGYIMVSDKMEYAMSRINMWIDPFTDWPKEGHQTRQSLISIGSGGLMGLGLGNSRQKHLYLPEPQNDFIFAIICEELGLIGAVFVIALFMLLIFRGFAIAMNARDKFGAMLAIGVTLQIGLQALLNIAVVTNAIPNTGISLPFFSQGGTSLFLVGAVVGVVVSVSSYSSTQTV